LAAGPFDGGSGTSLQVAFEHFLLDVTSGSLLTVTASGPNIVISWPPIPGTLQHSSSISSPNWQDVPGTPVLGGSGYSMTIPASGGTDFFRLKQ
jgi:hypothetical protein